MSLETSRTFFNGLVGDLRGCLAAETREATLAVMAEFITLAINSNQTAQASNVTEAWSEAWFTLLAILYSVPNRTTSRGG